jgi:hypothetical protein
MLDPGRVERVNWQGISKASGTHASPFGMKHGTHVLAATVIF